MALTITGVVVSDTNDKTITVIVKTRKVHPKYHKPYKSSKKFAVHDEKNQAKVGDKVEIIESVPHSKSKRWALSKVVETAKKVSVSETGAKDE